MTMQNRVVVDTSVAVKWVHQKNEDHLSQADKILEDAKLNGTMVHMPELAKYEVANALAYKGITPAQRRDSLATYYSIPVEFIQMDLVQAETALRIAQEYNLTFYDSSFIALTEIIGAIFITADLECKRKYKGSVQIVALKDYK